jgi:hypothetical protein
MKVVFRPFLDWWICLTFHLSIRHHCGGATSPFNPTHLIYFFLALLFVSFNFMLIAKLLDFNRCWLMEPTTPLSRHAFIAWIITSFNVVSFAFFSFFPSFFP